MYKNIKNNEYLSEFGNGHKVNKMAKKRIITISIVLGIANQMSGVNAIFFYAKQLFMNINENDV